MIKQIPILASQKRLAAKVRELVDAVNRIERRHAETDELAALPYDGPPDLVGPEGVLRRIDPDDDGGA